MIDPIEYNGLWGRVLTPKASKRKETAESSQTAIFSASPIKVSKAKQISSVSQASDRMSGAAFYPAVPLCTSFMITDLSWHKNPEEKLGSGALISNLQDQALTLLTWVLSWGLPRGERQLSASPECTVCRPIAEPLIEWLNVKSSFVAITTKPAGPLRVGPGE